MSVNDRGTALDALQERLVAWASADANVRALMVFGSLSSAARAPDEWTDLDLLVVARRPARLGDPRDWLASVGRPLMACTGQVEQTEQRLWRVLLADGPDLDVSIVSTTALRLVMGYLVLEARAPRLAAFVARHGGGRLHRDAHVFADTVEPGRRFLLDRDQLGPAVDRAMRPIGTRPAAEQPPSAAELGHVVAAFWQHALRAAKYVARGNLYAACERVDAMLAVPLLRMIQWHAGATRGWTLDFAHWRRTIDPRDAMARMERSADPRILLALRRTFARYDSEDVRRALWAATELFSLVARETAAAMGYEYPDEGEALALRRVGAVCRGGGRPCGT